MQTKLRLSKDSPQSLIYINVAHRPVGRDCGCYLVLLVIEAIRQHRGIRRRQAFNSRLAYTYVIGAALWNFVGAGVFGGGTLNAPLVNYYEHGTFLTLNHAHTALFGAFGLIAIGLVYFCLRYAAGENPNGSARNIAGLLNEKRNVLGLMPHPERVVDPLLGGTDGRAMFESLIEALG